MYKKITHQITEEHFEHPMAMHIKTAMDSGKITAPEAPIPASVIKFKSDAQKYFNDYLWRVRSFIVSYIDGPGEDLATIESQIFKDIEHISSLVKQYYGSGAATKVDIELKDITLALIEVIKTVKGGGDTTPTQDKCVASINVLANTLSAANPTFWPASAVNKILDAAAAAWVAQTRARTKKDWPADIAATDLARGIILSGQADGTPGFAQVFESGVIGQFPDLFKK